MKASIKLTALFLLATTSIFASVPATVKSAGAPSKKDVITVSAMSSNTGLAVNVEKFNTGKTVVVVMDKDNNVIFKDALPQGTSLGKGYILNQLEDGDYTMEVISNKEVVKKDIHVYQEDDTKTFLVKQ